MSNIKLLKSGGVGDMRKSVYDTDNDGVVDNADKLDNQEGSYYLDRSNHTGTQAASTISDFDTEVSNNTDVAANTSHRNTTSGNPHSVTKDDVGLGNVDNVQQIPLSQKGAANGVAELDSTGKVPSSQLPSYVDDVLTYDTSGDFPATGSDGIIYIAKDTNKTYRWNGSGYTEISESLALGETHSTAYYGDYGKVAYDHSQLTSGNPHSVTASDVGNGTAQWNANKLQGVDIDSTLPSDGQALVYDGSASKWKPAASGVGDMLKSTYDTDDSGIVDNSEQLEGHAGSYYLNRANHTGTQTASTISDFDTEVSNNTDVAANTSARHTQNTDTGTSASEFYVDTGGDNVAVKAHIQTTSGNPHNVTASDVGAVSTSGDETIAGIKTFSSFPITPSSAPSSNYQVANKKYVDDSISSAGGGDMLKSVYDTDNDGIVDKAESVDDGTYSTSAANVKTAYDHSQLTSGNPHSVSASDVGNTTAQWNADKLQGVDVDTTSPADGQVLTYDSATSKWKPDTVSSSGGDVVGPSSSTDNGIVRFDGTTGKLVQDSSNVVIDDSGNMGLGTTSPSSKLDVVGPITVSENQVGKSAALISYGNNGNGYGANAVLTGWSSAYPAAFGATGGTAQTFMTANAYYGTGSSTTFKRGSVTFNSQVLMLSMTDNNLYYKWEDNTGDTVNTDISTWQTRFMIEGDTGNVGIGTTTPSSKLEVKGTIKRNSGGATALQLYTTDTAADGVGTTIMFGEESDFYGGVSVKYNGGTTNHDKDMLFYTGGDSGTAKMTIDGNGNVGIGITTPTVKLDVDGDINISSGSVYRVDGNQISTGDILFDYIGTPTYTTIKDINKTTMSAGKISGGDITDNGDGTVSVAAGTGLIKTTNSDTGELKSFNWSANSSVSLTDNATNYIYVDYNSGSPQISVSTSVPTDHNTKVLLGLTYRDGTDLHILTAGQVISNYTTKIFWKDMEINGKFQRVNGLMISETGTRNIAITSGTIYAGLTKKTFSAFDSSGTDTFNYYYRDGSGGWTKVTGQTQIDNLHYDDGSGTLAELSNSSGWRHYYGVHWVYADSDGHVFVVYGQGNYSLSDAENTQPPATLPDIIESIGGLVGKIIIEKNASSFESIESAFNVFFVPHTVVNHNELGGLQGGTSDEYYHLTSADYTEATSFLNGGSKTHTEVDNHINSTSNPHSVTAAQVGNATAQWNADKLQGVDIDSTSPSDGQVLVYDSGISKWTPSSNGNGDMLKSVYDTDNNGIVDNSEQLEGHDSAYHLNRSNHTGTQTASTISDFDTEVSNNTNVSANTSARHTHSNKSLLDTYDQTNADLTDAVSKKHSQNTDTGTSASEFYIDTGGDNVAVKSHIQSTSNPHSVTAAQVGNTTAQWNANKLQGVDIDSTSPSDGYVLKYSSSSSKWEPAAESSSGGGITWTEITGTSQTASADNGYILNNSSLVTLTLPTTCAIGKIIRVAGKGSGGWKVAQNASQTIHFGNTDTTTGTSGYLASTNRYDAVELLCITADSDFVVLSSLGNITIA